MARASAGAGPEDGRRDVPPALHPEDGSGRAVGPSMGRALPGKGEGDLKTLCKPMAPRPGGRARGSGSRNPLKTQHRAEANA